MKQFYSLCMIMLLASVLAIDVMGQKTTLTVTGKVTDLEGDPLSGVSVVVQGTTRRHDYQYRRSILYKCTVETVGACFLDD